MTISIRCIIEAERISLSFKASLSLSCWIWCASLLHCTHLHRQAKNMRSHTHTHAQHGMFLSIAVYCTYSTSHMCTHMQMIPHNCTSTVLHYVMESKTLCAAPLLALSAESDSLRQVWFMSDPQLTEGLSWLSTKEPLAQLMCHSMCASSGMCHYQRPLQ